MASKTAEPTRRPAPRTQLSAEQWAEAALLAWGRGGLRAVAVEPLAKELGVTKGSFYWHFKSRAQLLESAMKYWQAAGTEAVIEELEAIDDPAQRLTALFAAAWNRVDHLRAEAAIGAAALSGEPTVTPIYEAVQQRRLDYVSDLYRQMGHSRSEARRRAIAAYSAFLGSVQIILMGDSALQTNAQLSRQLRLFTELFVPQGG